MMPTKLYVLYTENFHLIDATIVFAKFYEHFKVRQIIIKRAKSNTGW